MIKLINLKMDKQTPYDLYIGRANGWLGLAGSKWSNPFPMKNESERPEVLAKYRQHILSRPDLLAALPELTDKVLACYCYPKSCHGNVLIDLHKQFVNTNTNETNS